MAKLKIGNLYKVSSRYSDTVFLYLPTEISISKDHRIDAPNESIVMYLGIKSMISEEDQIMRANSIVFIPKYYFRVLYLNYVGFVERGWVTMLDVEK